MGAIRILAFSDIHNRSQYVKKLRKREADNFDVVVIAGDMGNDGAAEILGITSTFSCPVLYIYGNWDNQLAYDLKFTDNSIHLHNECISINGYSFAGFSGCDASWGKNPIAESIRQGVDTLYKDHLSRFNEIKETAYNESIPYRHERTETQNRFIRMFESQARGYKTLQKKLNSLNKQIKDSYSEVRRFTESKEHKAYIKAVLASDKNIERLNRISLCKTIDERKAKYERTFLITHARLYKTDHDMPNLLAHLFGHRHGFKKTINKNTTFVNVSVLDYDKPTYCIIEAKDSELKVECRHLN